MSAGEVTPLLEEQRAAKIEEVRASLEKLDTVEFEQLENLQRLRRLLNTEVQLLLKASQKQLEKQLVTCNYAFYKSIIEEVEKMGNVTAVLKTFKRDKVSVTVDIVTKEPHVWIKLVNRPAKTVLVEYRDGKKNGDVIAQIKQHLHVSHRFNNPEIRVLFNNGVLREQAEKLTRHGITVIGERVEKEDPTLVGKWNDELIERLGESEDSEWDDDEETKNRLKSPPSETQQGPSVPTLNLDISAVMLLVSNMCEPNGAKYIFQENMINKHAECERQKPAKAGVLEKLKGHKLIMSEMAFKRVSAIVSTVGGPAEKQRFAELAETIERIPDQKTAEVGRVAQLANIKGITAITKRVFSCAEITKTKTVTANSKFLTHARAKNIFFSVIEISPRPLTEQKEATAEPI